ncbi:MAG: Holliday junction resolvase RuvX [Candidatus Doudnabacteria bacterium]|nr:Holliday junction resolvase RuvX [Candidatus Doudnabacteria bacterium]
MRILALDWGSKRIGAAISDEQQKIAFPFEKVIETKNAVEEIKKITGEFGVEKVLIGLPTGLKGQATASTEKAKEFIIKLKAETSQPVELLDERLSSVAAQKILTQQGVSQKNQREIKDNIAAQTLLQNYLDRHE